METETDTSELRRGVCAHCGDDVHQRDGHKAVHTWTHRPRCAEGQGMAELQRYPGFLPPQA